MDKSPLSKLPPEIRNEIWKLCLQCPEPIVLGEDGLPIPLEHKYDHIPGRSPRITSRKLRSRLVAIKLNPSHLQSSGSHLQALKDRYDLPPSRDSSLYLESAQRLALTQTCKAIHAETNEFFFAINTFQIFIRPKMASPTTRLAHFYARLAKRHVAAIGSMEICFEMAGPLLRFLTLRNPIYAEHYRYLAEHFFWAGLRDAVEVADSFPRVRLLFGMPGYGRGLLRVNLVNGAEKGWNEFVEENFLACLGANQSKRTFFERVHQAMRNAGETFFSSLDHGVLRGR